MIGSAMFLLAMGIVLAAELFRWRREKQLAS